MISRNVLVLILLSLVVTGCTSDPYTRETKVSETVQHGTVAAAQCGGITLLANVLGGRSAGDSLTEASKAAAVCGVAGAIAGAQLDAYEQELLKEFQNAGVKIAIRQEARVLEIDEPITFPRNAARLSPSGAGKVEAIAKILHKYNERQVDIIGHTASDEPAGLGQVRARTVASRLQEMTQDRVPLKTTNKAAAEPVGDNETETGRARNRRVGIFIALRQG